jgi:hypothetical protein
MKAKLLIILFTLYFIQSYSQDFGKIKLDSKLQIKYSDTLQKIEKRITGKWKYLGKRTNGILKDTIEVSFSNDRKTIITVENGIVIESKRNKRKKADYFYQMDFNFKSGIGIYSFEKMSINGLWESVTSCQPIMKLVYYDNKIGILMDGTAEDSFSQINELTSEKLVIENGKEYLKLK